MAELVFVLKRVSGAKIECGALKLMVDLGTKTKNK